jgi:preprotein translocase subunit YajC
MGGVIFLVVMLVVAYFLVIMPQQRRVRAHRALVSALHVGDDVMTTSGILGTINSIDDDILQLEVAPGVQLRVVRGAIARRMGPAGPSATDDAAEDAGAGSEAASAAEE